MSTAASKASRLAPVIAHSRPHVLPASYVQQRLWFLDQLGGGSPEYNMPQAMRLRGPLDAQALEEAVNGVIARHESLRTHFAAVDGQPVQIVAPTLRVTVPVTDIANLDASAREEALRAAIWREWHEPFELDRCPLLRLRLLRYGDDDYVLLQTLHHTIADGWSLALFNYELWALYEAMCAGRPHSLPPLPVQYADFVMWQRETCDGGALKLGLEYWTKQLAAVREHVLVPTNGARRVPTFEAEVCNAWFTTEQLAALRSVGESHRVTLYMTMLAAFAIVLARTSGQNDLVVASPVANRQDKNLEWMIGCLVNTVALRLAVRPASSLAELLVVVRQVVLDAFRHQQVPFERVVEALAPHRNLSSTPIYNVMLVFHQAPALAPSTGNLTVVPIESDVARVRCDLELHVSVHGNGLCTTWLFNRALFESWYAAQMVRQYERVLMAFTRDLSRPVWAIPLLSKSERQSLLGEPPAIAAHRETTLTEAFEAQVAQTPDAIAVVDDRQRFTYEWLDGKANQLARVLIRQGIGAETVVAIALPRTAELLVGIVAVLKAGAAYLPLDAEYPPARIEALFAEVGPLAVLTHSEHAVYTPSQVPCCQLDAPVVIAACAAESASPLADSDRAAPVHPMHPAYVIYTSGSTGTPKGVVVSHANVVRLFEGSRDVVEFGADDVWSLFHSAAFDFSVWEMWGPLLHGGHVAVVPWMTSRSPEEFLRFLFRHQVTILSQTPSAFRQLQPLAQDEHGTGIALAVRTIIFGGEALGPSLVKQWYEQYASGIPALINGYGITETTVFSTFAKLTATDGTGLTTPIGRGISSLRLYVLDNRLELVPAGVAGELYISGGGVARGYGRRPALTAERFVADPYGRPGTRMYRSGDRARWRPDGQLEFLGRSDRQVKVRGFRVELTEIEATVLVQPGVKDALAVIDEAAGEHARLLAYVVAHREASDATFESRLRDALEAQLPTYMVPAAIVVIERWPLTPNGKVDRSALPKPRFAPRQYGDPRTPQEELLCELAADVLEVPRAGLDDNFFALGGHSLLATRLVSRIREALGIEVPIRALFESSTLADLSRRLREAGPSEMPLLPQQRPVTVPLSYPQQRLWFIAQLNEDSPEYNVPDAVRIRGPLDRAALVKAVNAIVARHESLRTRFAVVDGQPVQITVPSLELDIPTEDLRGLPADTHDVRVRAALRHEWAEPLDLKRGPLVRVRLLQLGEQDHVLLRTLHHIISDAWSQSLFTRELTALYQAFSTGRDSGLPELTVQYADFTLWQRQRVANDSLDEGLRYWTKQLADIPEGTTLPPDRPAPPKHVFEGKLHLVPLSAERLDSLKDLSRANGATLYMTLLAAFAVVLSRYSGQRDLVIGSGIANRQEKQLEALIGFFVNQLVIRIRTEPDTSVRELLHQVRKTTLDAFRYQDVPFERLVEALAPRRQSHATPLYQVAFVMQNAPSARLRLEGLSIEPVLPDTYHIHNDLVLNAWEDDGELALAWFYNFKRFDQSRIAQMAWHLTAVLDAFVEDSSQKIRSIRLPDRAERSQSFIAIVEDHAVRTPDAIAVVCGADHLTYRALNRRANQLAHVLILHGAGPESSVGAALFPGVARAVAFLAILKAGGTYVPLDLHYPVAHLARTLAEIKPVCVITESAAPLVETTSTRIVIDSPVTMRNLSSARDRNPTDTDRTIRLRPEHPAYVMFTSGSTGTPKGVVVTCAGLANLARAQHPLALGGGARVSQFSSVAADASVWEFVMALASGAALVVIPEQQRKVDQLAQALVEGSVSHALLTPSVVSAMGAAGVATLDTLILGGEACPADAAMQWATDRRAVVNAYGPTEITVCATLSGPLMPDRVPPIGRPLDGMRAYVLDADLNLVPDGAIGELYVAGVGVARGYRGRAALSAERFVADPSGPRGTRMYRTGDLARWHSGQLEFFGRVDHQVKIRGFRVELGEVEATLARQPGVVKAVVDVREERPWNKRLVAYIEEAPSTIIDTKKLRERLASVLPDHMVPGPIVKVSEWPLTGSGKINRSALPSPELVAEPSASQKLRTPEEELLCGIFGEVLGADVVTVDDDFFALGGHSLLAVSLVSRIRAAFGVELSLDVVMQASTPRGIAQYLRKAPAGRAPITPQARPAVLPASFAQRRLWFLDRLGGSTEYNVPDVLHLRGFVERAVLEDAVNAIVARHESLRTHFAEVNGEPVQVIAPVVSVTIPVDDLRGLDVDARDEAVRAAIHREWAEPFDLSRGPVLRVRMLRIADDEHLLLRTVHHIVSDGWSHGVFNRELMTFYGAFRKGGHDPLPPLRVQYADFALWQRAYVEGGAIEESLAYWREQLAGMPEGLGLPTDRPRPSTQTFNGAICRSEVGQRSTTEIQQFCRGHDVTLYMTLLAAFGVLLNRYTAQQDIVVGSPIANRQDASLEELIGFFVNSLALRMRVSPQATFSELVADVRRVALDAYRHQDVPFERVVEMLAPKRRLDRMPLFQVMFALQNAPRFDQQLDGVAVEFFPLSEYRLRFDLEVYAIEGDRGLELWWLYNQSLCDEWRISQMAQHYLAILESVRSSPDTPLYRLSMMSSSEVDAVVEQFNTAN